MFTTLVIFLVGLIVVFFMIGLLIKAVIDKDVWSLVLFIFLFGFLYRLLKPI
jgi:uncharacterized protein (DUF983 family)